MFGLEAVIAATLSTVAGTLFNLVVAKFFRRDRVEEAAEDPSERLQRRIDRVNVAFAEAASLMDELQRDLEAQQLTRAALLEEAQRQQELLALNEEQAEKIRGILVHETRSTIRAERRQQMIYFIAGVVVSALLSIPIGIWVNSIS
ncbi:hypothetical protein AB0K16_52510 [Nonomuraea jabiensis]|uniref:hypothetical protein n=1 Tax=Nonomuraea jabiensis TaxID=882448 RepID=UPI003413A898